MKVINLFSLIRNRFQKSQHKSLLADFPPTMPAYIRSEKIQARAATVGFDWPDALAVLNSLKEEVIELEHELRENQPREKQLAELGDILFTCVNLARHLDTHSEHALHLTNEKFVRRFQFIEQRLQEQQLNFSDLTFDEMLRYWQEAKREE